MPIFAIGRVPGWTVEVLEQYDNNMLIRPLTFFRRRSPGPTYLWRSAGDVVAERRRVEQAALRPQRVDAAVDAERVSLPRLRSKISP